MFKNLFKSISHGADIGDESIKFIELIKIGNSFKVNRYGEKKIEEGILEGDKEKMKETLNSFKKEFKVESVYTFSSIEHKAETIANVLIKRGDKETYMIVDLGNKSVGVFIVSNNIVMSSIILNIRGVEIPDLRDALMKHFIYWHTYKDIETKIKPPIKKIILCGDNDNLEKLAEYFSLGLKTKVELANVWTNILDTSKDIPEMTREESFKYAGAIAIALERFK